MSIDNATQKFDEQNFRNRMNSIGKLSSFTVLVTIKVENLTGVYNPVLMSQGTKRSGLVWNMTRRGSMIFGLLGIGTYETPIVFTGDALGEWTQIGLSIDNAKNLAGVYVNGDLIGSGKISNFTPVDFGKLEIGNWKLKDNAWQPNGAIESIMIFDRVLEMTEIRKEAAEPVAAK